MIEFAKKLFPLNRSLTGKGNVETLKLIKSQLPNLQIKYFSSEEKVFDWQIPMEWNVRDAWLKDRKGRKILNFKENNLVLLGYSKSINKVVNYKILKKNIYTLKSKPNAIPYLTSYYKKRWGFCMKHKDFKKLDKNKNYHAYINSSLKKGKMHYGELKIPGKSKNEIFFSTYICCSLFYLNEI